MSVGFVRLYSTFRRGRDGMFTTIDDAVAAARPRSALGGMTADQTV